MVQGRDGRALWFEGDKRRAVHEEEAHIFQGHILLQMKALNASREKGSVSLEAKVDGRDELVAMNFVFKNDIASLSPLK